jgi:hypothetical protein
MRLAGNGEGEGFVAEDGSAVLVSSDLRGPSTARVALRSG